MCAQLWGEREAIVASMRSELGAEQQRHQRVWKESWGQWEQVQSEYAAMRDELQQQRVEGQEVTKAMHVEMAQANASMAAEINLLQHERNTCRSERRDLASSLLQHRSELGKHREWLFDAMQKLAREREQSVYAMAWEGISRQARSEQITTEAAGPPTRRPLATSPLPLIDHSVRRAVLVAFRCHAGSAAARRLAL